MQTFREFIEQKPWKAGKAEVVQFWQSLRPNMPIVMEPVPPEHKGTKFNFDGLRITGRPEFIGAVLSRLKDILNLESQGGTKLDIEYRQVENKEGVMKTQADYVFYVHATTETPKQEKPNASLV